MLSDPSVALSVSNSHFGFDYIILTSLTGMSYFGFSQVVFDKDGVLEQICHGKGYIDMSTVGADTSSKISEV